MVNDKSSLGRAWLGGVALLILAIIAGVVLYAWIHLPPMALPQRLPSEDGRRVSTGLVQNAAQGLLEKGDGVASPCTSLWPQFRGPASDGINRETIPLADRWPVGGPRQLWGLSLGEGHAGAAVYGGCVYLLDYDRTRQRDVIRCLSLDDGRDLWRYSYPVAIKRNHGMSRTIPAVDEHFVVAIGPKGHVTCLDRRSGRYLWSRDLAADFGTTIPPWYAGQCPIIENGHVIVAPAGPSVLMAALDCASGRILWQTPNPRGWGMSHSSIIPMASGSHHLYLYCALGGLAAIDSVDGSMKWLTAEWRIQIATIPSPVVLDSRRLFLAGGYNAGSALLEVVTTNGILSPRLVRRWPAVEFGAEQQTPIAYNGDVYGIRPPGQLVCFDVESGKTRWTSGPGIRFGLGPFVVGGDKIYALADTGRLYMVRADRDRFEILDQAQVLDGHDAWAPLALAGGRLLVRDLTTLKCLDVRSQGGAP